MALMTRSEVVTVPMHNREWEKMG